VAAAAATTDAATPSTSTTIAVDVVGPDAPW
jgi:hypothetical protein